MDEKTVKGVAHIAQQYDLAERLKAKLEQLNELLKEASAKRVIVLTTNREQVTSVAYEVLISVTPEDDLPF